MFEQEFIERFWARFDRGGGPDACWEWQGSRAPFGHGVINKVPGQKFPMGTHRLAFLLAHGYLTPGLVIRHKCDNAPCGNPAHLQEGTQKENIHDMLSRGRHRLRLREPRPPMAPGEPLRLPAEDRIAMLDIEEVTKQLKVSESTIRGLVRSGKLRAYRIGGKRGQLRFREEDLAAYIESTLVQPEDADDEGETKL